MNLTCSGVLEKIEGKGEEKRSFLGGKEIIMYCDWGGGYTSVYICQKSSTCRFKSCVCKLYFNKVAILEDSTREYSVLSHFNPRLQAVEVIGLSSAY